MSPVAWILAMVAAGLGFLLVQAVHLAVVLAWEDRRTTGLRYYGLSPEERRRFRRTLRLHRRLLRPVLTLVATVSDFDFGKVGFEHRGLAGPKGTCDEGSFAAAEAYDPRPEDVFVVTQMKCGTTWMQHLIYELLHRGGGDLVGSGRTLHAVSPWLESRKSVAVDDAPLLGDERPTRLLKTHFPAPRCPFDARARYVYVTRHPASCFASLVAFLGANAGAMAPELDRIEDWFCSENMWWGPWPDHVAGWCRRAASEPNVLFIRFEEMKRDLPAVTRRVADFLGLEPLADDELEQVVRRCSFAYMRRHAEAFEMHPPHLLSVDAEFFVKGTSRRHEDVPPETRLRIERWCASRLETEGVVAEELYPDLDGVGSWPRGQGKGS